MLQETITPDRWRVFRTVIRELDDEQFPRAIRSSRMELESRLEADEDPIRMFLSTLTYEDLLIAVSEIEGEERARAKDHELCKNTNSAGSPMDEPPALLECPKGADGRV